MLDHNVIIATRDGSGIQVKKRNIDPVLGKAVFLQTNIKARRTGTIEATVVMAQCAGELVACRQAFGQD